MGEVKVHGLHEACGEGAGEDGGGLEPEEDELVEGGDWVGGAAWHCVVGWAVDTGGEGAADGDAARRGEARRDGMRRRRRGRTGASSSRE